MLWYWKNCDNKSIKQILTSLFFVCWRASSGSTETRKYSQRLYSFIPTSIHIFPETNFFLLSASFVRSVENGSEVKMKKKIQWCISIILCIACCKTFSKWALVHRQKAFIFINKKKLYMLQIKWIFVKIQLKVTRETFNHCSHLMNIRKNWVEICGKNIN